MAFGSSKAESQGALIKKISPYRTYALFCRLVLGIFSSSELSIKLSEPCQRILDAVNQVNSAIFNTRSFEDSDLYPATTFVKLRQLGALLKHLDYPVDSP